MGRSTASYEPDEADVWYRANAAAWFTAIKWPDAVIDDIMYRENPTIDTVRRLVDRYGIEAAFDLIVRMNRD